MKRKTRAIPIRVHDFSDSSQIVSLFTADSGLVDAIAKGAYRPRNAFQGCFDLAVLREVVYVDRRRGPGLSILTESRVLDGYRGVRRTWPRHAAACYVLEFLRAVCVAGHSEPELFDLVSGVFAALGETSESDIGRILLHFEVRALRLLGFLGRIGACVVCGRAWPGRSRGAFFCVEDGGLVCRACRRTRTGRAATALTGLEVEVLRSWANSSRILAPDALEEAVRPRVHRAVARGAVFFLERPLRMMKYSAAWL